MFLFDGEMPDYLIGSHNPSDIPFNFAMILLEFRKG